MSEPVSESTVDDTTIKPTQVLLAKSSTLKMVRKKIQDILEIALRTILFWETEDARIGSLLKVGHQYFVSFIVLCYILVHTLVPSYWFMVTVWITVVSIWIQHILLGGCVLTRLEHKLTGEKTTIVDPILDLFQIPITPKSQMGITILFSTISSVFLSFELFTRTLLNIRSWIPALS
jgi:hypothetical protein